MPGDHAKAINAIESWLNKEPEPSNGFRGLVPGPDWGHAWAAGSHQIPMMACLAGWMYDGFKGYLSLRWHSYADETDKRQCYEGSEPYSSIYSRWTVTVWIAVAHHARLKGDLLLADKFDRLLAQWWASCRLSQVICPSGGLDDFGRRAFPGKIETVMAGCRSWGFPNSGLPFGMGRIWRIARGDEAPSSNQDWTTRLHRLCLETMRRTALPFVHATPQLAFQLCPQIGLRENFEWHGYEDGSVVHIMGMDEPEENDEDDNGNTPGFLAVVADRTRDTITAYPEWPAPNNGETHIRQTGMHADIDRHPSGSGWILRHSHIGRRQVNGAWETDIPEPQARLAYSFRARAFQQGWIDLMTQPVTPPVTPPQPPPAVPAKKKRPDPTLVLGVLILLTTALLMILRGCS